MNVSCPKCQAKLKSANLQAGMKVKCPRCAAPFMIAAQDVPISLPAPVEAKIGDQPTPDMSMIQEIPSSPEGNRLQPLLWIGTAAALLLLTLGGLSVVVVLAFNSRSDQTVQTTPVDNPLENIDTPTLPPGNRIHEQENPEPPGRIPVDDEENTGKKKSGGLLDQVLDPIPPKKDSPAKSGGGRLPDLEVEFLASKAKGQRFVIIADRSGSMSMGRGPNRKGAMDHLHDELIKTVKTFKPGSHYYISFFDSVLTPMPFGDNWIEGGQNVDQIIDWIKTVQPRGGTVPGPSFRKAFSLDPLPDAIFFMTDGIFSPNVVKEVAQLNQNAKQKIPINTIIFHFRHAGAGMAFTNRYGKILETYILPPNVKTEVEKYARGGLSSELTRAMPLMKQIAEDSGGTFTQFSSGDEKQLAKPTNVNPAKTPVLAVAGELDETDNFYLHRRNCRYKAFNVTLQAGKTYHIDMLARFDAYLFLTDTKGRVLRQNDDGGIGLNSLIVYQPTVSGTYRVIATSFDQAIGPFVVTVTEGF